MKRIAHRTRISLRKRNVRDAEHNDKHLGKIVRLDLKLTSPCEEYPYFGMDESYNLTIATQSLLVSNSVWGILRGMETFSQLFYLADVNYEVRINKTEIYDYPRYAHRGLLIDTSRHYLSLTKIQKTLDAMAMNKMNVLHWHIVDDQSFPYKSDKFPDLSRMGAYHPSMVYDKQAIEGVINYAKNRGIRVIPEFDVPGHTSSWGVAYPNILTRCYQNGQYLGLGPMNPIHNVTYKLLQDLFREVQERFPDKYFHVGGDEVELDCWESNTELREYMTQHDMTSATQLHSLFMANVIPLLGNNAKAIVWQEVYDEDVTLSNGTLIHVWKDNDINEMISILRDGHQLIYSSAWYLDHLKSGGDWADFYQADPRQMVRRYDNDVKVENIVGGEACMWGEVVNDFNIISRVWPRASAVAEKLWSAEINSVHEGFYDYRVPNDVYSRLEEHTCRMNRRGIHAQPPSGPGFCLGSV
ncbi:hypothetical protein O3G_MSEX009696 [Manduca sexta]|uniref:Chitooligosaccharidolytic beta-N-acetylglucosaminidase n=2 Tax=Manduca sexta TaxID=7130 RepID=A0A921ZF01_MANSE|nr:hypothetical protein O3G_MSEX009696 [Manduca sexta]